MAESKNFRPQCVGVDPPRGIWAHICGSDLVRDKDGTIYVLEDNLRVPSGVSYMLENRLVTKRVFPELFEAYAPLPVDDYPSQLFETLAAISPRKTKRPEVVVLTPGIYNSAYFEHAYLAQQMGCELVEGRDLFVDDDDCVYMRTVSGPQRVDVIYRRIDDEFMDPEVLPPGLDARRPRPAARLEGRQRGTCQRTGRRRGRRQGGLRLRSGDHQVLPGRGSDHPQRAHLPLHVRGRARLCARPSRGAGGQAGQRVRRLRHAHGPHVHQGRAGNVRTRSSARIRATTSPSRRSPCPPSPRW